MKKNFKLKKSQLQKLLTTKKSTVNCFSGGCNRVKKIQYQGFLKLPLPHSMAEFDVLSEIVWGTKIGIKRLEVFKTMEGNGMCSYEIEKKYDTYRPTYKQEDALGLDQYELNRMFCQTIFGMLSCGGIGGNAYGQAYVLSHRQKIALEKLNKDRCKSVDQRRTLRPAFVRLAQQYGLGEIKVKAGE